MDEERIVELVRTHFPLTPQGMIEHLQLRRPIYRLTAAFGHFGRPRDSFTWEKADKAMLLRDDARLATARPELAAPFSTGLREIGHGAPSQNLGAPVVRAVHLVHA